MITLKGSKGILFLCTALLIFFFFLMRCPQAVIDTFLEFSKLEKIELGGIKGRILSDLVMDIYKEFNEDYKVFSESTFDPLDPDKPVGPAVSCLTPPVHLYSHPPFHLIFFYIKTMNLCGSEQLDH